MKKNLIGLAFLIYLNINSQVRTEILIVTDSIYQAYKRLPGHHISEDNRKDLDLLGKFMQEFEMNVSDDELIYIYKNDFKPKIKQVALSEIFKRNNIDKIQLFKETVHLKDEIEFYYGTFPIQSFFFEDLTVDETNLKVINDLVDYIFKSEPLNIPLIEAIAYKIPNTENYYEKIRKLTIEYHSKYLMLFIAGFKNRKDIDLIKSFGKESLDAIRIFPDEQFIPFLEIMADKEIENYEYLNVVAKFCKNRKSYHLINKIHNILKDNKSSQLSTFEYYLENEKDCHLK